MSVRLVPPADLVILDDANVCAGLMAELLAEADEEREPLVRMLLFTQAIQMAQLWRAAKRKQLYEGTL